jgi:hypothetical protein
MKKLSIPLIFFIVASFCYSWQIKLVKIIPIRDDKIPLLLSGAFIVLDDGSFLFTDIKDKDRQFKLFNREGKLLKAWGRMGPGPDEFGGLGCIDYQSPLMAVFDAGKERIHVYEKQGDYDFKKISDVLAWEANSQIKLYKKDVLVCGSIHSPKGKAYVLFMRDFDGRNTKYILPIEDQYGRGSLKVQEEVSGVSYLSFIDIYEDTIFYVSDMRLKIAKIDAKTFDREFIGNEPKNFRPLVMSRKTRSDLLQPANKTMEALLADFSFITGIFADRDLVGVIYVNREKKINHELDFVPYVQVYDHSGRLMNEQSLAPFYAEDRFIPMIYKKDKRHLYLLSMTSNETAYNYAIYDYFIEQ